MSRGLLLLHHQHQRPAMGEGQLRRAQPNQASGQPAPEHPSPQRVLQHGGCFNLKLYIHFTNWEPGAGVSARYSSLGDALAAVGMFKNWW